jgi:hypothetical protein
MMTDKVKRLFVSSNAFWRLRTSPGPRSQFLKLIVIFQFFSFNVLSAWGLNYAIQSDLVDLDQSDGLWIALGWTGMWFCFWFGVAREMRTLLTPLRLIFLLGAIYIGRESEPTLLAVSVTLFSGCSWFLLLVFTFNIRLRKLKAKELHRVRVEAFSGPNTDDAHSVVMVDS